jgi:hypothetical protein
MVTESSISPGDVPGPSISPGDVVEDSTTRTKIPNKIPDT